MVPREYLWCVGGIYEVADAFRFTPIGNAVDGVVFE